MSLQSIISKTLQSGIPGFLSLAGAILLEDFMPETSNRDFLIGLLMGLSLVFNIYFIISATRKTIKQN